MQNEYNICIRRLRNWLSHYFKFTCNYKCYSHLYTFFNSLLQKINPFEATSSLSVMFYPLQGHRHKVYSWINIIFFSFALLHQVELFFMFYFILPFELFHILGNKLYYFVKIDAITETVIDDKYVKDNTERYHSSVLSSGKVDDCYFTI